MNKKMEGYYLIKIQTELKVTFRCNPNQDKF